MTLVELDKEAYIEICSRFCSSMFNSTEPFEYELPESIIFRDKNGNETKYVMTGETKEEVIYDRV